MLSINRGLYNISYRHIILYSILKNIVYIKCMLDDIKKNYKRSCGETIVIAIEILQ